MQHGGCVFSAPPASLFSRITIAFVVKVALDQNATSSPSSTGRQVGGCAMVTTTAAAAQSDHAPHSFIAFAVMAPKRAIRAVALPCPKL
jgi:hypothetical protein